MSKTGANVEVMAKGRNGLFSTMSGGIGERLVQCKFDPRALRPWQGVDDRGRVRGVYIDGPTANSEPEQITGNANSTLRRDEWKLFDDGIQEAAREELRAVADLRSRGLTFNLPNGMAHTVLETERITDITGATVGMEPARKSEGDLPEYDTVLLPLPLIWKDFTINRRALEVSRNSGKPLDTTTAMMATRVVIEEAEKLLIGTSDYNSGASGYTYGGGNMYGYLNFPESMAKVISDPSQSPWDTSDLMEDVLAMRRLSVAAFHRGPWVLYVAPGWDPYLDRDYSTQYPGVTVRDRLLKIKGISAIETLDYLTGFKMIMVQMTQDVVREVMGMDVQTVQWTDNGGFTLNFKVMAMMVPQIRSDINGKTGIVVADVA